MNLFTFLSVGYLINLVWFIVAFFISAFIPGWIIISKTELKLPHKLLLAPVLGICLFALQAYLFGYLGLRWLSYVYLGVFIGFFITQNKLYFSGFNGRKLKHYVLSLFLDNKLACILIAVGVLAQTLPVFFSGWLDQSGLSFWFLNAYDGVLHLSFIESIKNHFPPIQPGAWDLPITNYHYWSDLVMAEFVRIWRLPSISVYFHYFPPVLSWLLGLLVYVLPQLWTQSKKVGILSLLFYYFGGDFTYIFSLMINHGFGRNIDLIDNGIIQFMNMPQAFAKLIFLGSILVFHYWSIKPTRLLSVLLGLMIASLFAFKVYFGFFALLGLGLVIIYRIMVCAVKIIKSHKSFALILSDNKMLIFTGVLTIILSLLVFLPTNKGAGGLFWAPLDWPKLFLGSQKLNWNEWWLRMQVYQAAGNIKAIFVYNAMSLLIFLSSIFNFRLLGLFSVLFISKKYRADLFLFLIVPIIVTSFLGLNFLQVSGGHNIFNFFVVSLVVLNIITPMLVVGKNQRTWSIVLVLLFLLSLPRTGVVIYGFLKNYYNNADKQTISLSEIEALKFLKYSGAQGLLLQSPNNHLNYQTPYTYFLSQKYSYLGGAGILNSHNQPIAGREKIVEYIFTATDSAKIAKILKLRDISHIYLKNNHISERPMFLISTASAALAPTYFNQVFKNDEIEILSVK